MGARATMTRPADPELVRHLESERGSLTAFLLMATGDPERADEAFQETCLEIWRARERYDPTRPFGAWARGFARIVLLRARRKQGRDRLTPFTPETLERLADEWSDEDEGHGREAAALRHCLDELSPDQRALLDARYRNEESFEAMAGRRGSTADAVKMTIHRLRTRLRACAERRLRREASDA